MTPFRFALLLFFALLAYAIWQIHFLYEVAPLLGKPGSFRAIAWMLVLPGFALSLAILFQPPPAFPGLLVGGLFTRKDGRVLMTCWPFRNRVAPTEADALWLQRARNWYLGLFFAYLIASLIVLSTMSPYSLFLYPRSHGPILGTMPIWFFVYAFWHTRHWERA